MSRRSHDRRPAAAEPHKHGTPRQRLLPEIPSSPGACCDVVFLRPNQGPGVVGNLRLHNRVWCPRNFPPELSILHHLLGRFLFLERCVRLADFGDSLKDKRDHLPTGLRDDLCCRRRRLGCRLLIARLLFGNIDASPGKSVSQPPILFRQNLACRPHGLVFPIPDPGPSAARPSPCPSPRRRPCRSRRCRRSDCWKRRRGKGACCTRWPRCP